MTELKQYRMSASSAAELVAGVEAAVVRGDLAPGEQLPSVRRLAADVGLSPVTVVSAIAELRRRGVVVTEPRRGSRIGERPPIGALRSPMPVPTGARDLSLGNPDPALLPDLGRVLARTRLPVRLYGEPAALQELAQLSREQLAADGIAGDSACIVSGALDAIERVIEAHLQPGDRVAVESPGYAALFDLLRARGLTLEPVAVDELGMHPAALKAALRRGASAAILTPRGQNPTGAALDAGRARELRDVFDGAPDTLVIEDDHLGAVAGAELHTTVTGRSRWAATRSVAKALGPDLRLAVLVGDEQTIARVQGRQQCGPGWVSHILQRLVLELWRDESSTALIERACETYAARRGYLLDALRERSLAAVGRSGLNLWVAVPDETAVVSTLLGRGWVVAPGAPFRLAGGPTAIRITIATLLEHEAQRLADDLAEILGRSGAPRAG
jgi:DNA-binding transcriptional MocR family regulator